MATAREERLTLPALPTRWDRMSLDLDLSLDTLIAWKRKPYAMVEDLFGVKPDPWQLEAFEAFPHAPRMAMKSCAGPGKTALLAWLGWNFLLTRPHPMIGATSVNAANLRANLWTELARWYAAPRAGILRALFTMTKTEIFANDHPQTWRLEARTWAQDANAEQIGNALAGLHAKFVMWLSDEFGAYPELIMPVCEAIFAERSDPGADRQAGNPTHLSGPLSRHTPSAPPLAVIDITDSPDDPRGARPATRSSTLARTSRPMAGSTRGSGCACSASPAVLDRTRSWPRRSLAGA